MKKLGLKILGGIIGAVLCLALVSAVFFDSSVSAGDKTPVTITGLAAPVEMPVFTGDAISEEIFGTPSVVVTEDSQPVDLDGITLVYQYTGCDSTVYDGTTPPSDAGSYKLKVIVSEEDEIYTGEGEEIAFTIEKATYETPEFADAVTVSYAEDKISVNSGYELSFNETFAEDDLITDQVDITAGAKYYFRHSGDANHNASEAGDRTFVRPGAPAEKEGYTVDYVNEQLVIEDGYEISASDEPFAALTLTDGKYDITPGDTYFIRKAGSDEESKISSEAREFRLDTRQAVPESPEVLIVASNDIMVSATPGQEFSINGGASWSDTGIFTGLTPHTEYSIVARMKAIEGEKFCSMASEPCVVTTKYSKPAAPALEDFSKTVTEDSISFVPLDPETNYIIKYLDNSSIWTESENGIIEGLQPGTKYELLITIAETEDTPESEALTEAVYTTPSKPEIGEGYEIDFANEKLIVADGYEVGMIEYPFSKETLTNGALDITPGSIIYIRKPAIVDDAAYNGGSFPSESTPIAIQGRPDAPSSPSFAYVTDTIVMMVEDEDLEFSKDDGVNWQRSESFTGLAAETSYSIVARFAATPESFASEKSVAATVTTKTAPGPAPSVAAFDVMEMSNRIEIAKANPYDTNVYEFAIGDGEFTTNGEFKGLLSDTDYILKARIAGTDTAMPSEAVSISAHTTKSQLKAQLTVKGDEAKGIPDTNYTTFKTGITEQLITNSKVSATVTAEDHEYGIDTIAYCVSTEELSVEQLDTIDGWIPYIDDGIEITKDGNYLIYARVININGDKVYVVSDWQLIDTKLPEIIGIANGDKYCGDKSFTAYDENMVSVTCDGEELTSMIRVYTIVADDKSHTIVATDAAGNTTTISDVTVYANHQETAIGTSSEPTCTEKGITAGVKCSVCGTVIEPQTDIPALGHDWSGEWKTTVEATATTEGKMELECARHCGAVQTQVIPATGKEEESPWGETAGDLAKITEIAKDAPIEAAAIATSKEELAEIFTEGETSLIEAGADAIVYLSINVVDESALSAAEKAEIDKATASVGADTKTLVVFDASLFKKVGAGEAVEVPEPGVNITVSVVIPESLAPAAPATDVTRTYKVIRMHEGTATVLDAVYDPTTRTATFVTDGFSTYMVVYNDVAKTVPSKDDPKEDTPAEEGGQAIDGGSTANGTAPILGDNGALYIYIILAVVALAGAGVVAVKRR